MYCNSCQFGKPGSECKTRGEYGVNLCQAQWAWLRWDPEEGWVQDDSKDHHTVVGVWDPDFGWMPFFHVETLPEWEGDPD
jgi:hypothetical protein